MPKWQVLNGHILEWLRKLAKNSVNMIFTSPPYWSLRDYGLLPSIWDGDPKCDHAWGDDHFCQKCGAWRGCLGLEPTLDLFIKHMITIFREARRVLHPLGTLWINMGDSYFGDSPVRSRSADAFSQEGVLKRSAGGNRRSAASVNGLKAKDLMGVPWTLALALREDGWYLRNDIIWCKGLDRSDQELEAQAEVEKALKVLRYQAEISLFGLDKATTQALDRAEKAIERLFMVGAAMPESVKDRVTASHEYLFMFSKKRRYYWDRMAIRAGIRSDTVARVNRNRNDGHKYAESAQPGQLEHTFCRSDGQPLYNVDRGGRNARTVWRVPTEGHKPFILPDGEIVAHFASFPRALPARAIRAATSEHGCCATCRAPFRRIIKPSAEYAKMLGRDWADYEKDAAEGRGHSVSNQRTQKRGPAATAEYITIGWEPTCRCHGEPKRGLVTCKKCKGTGQKRQSTKRQDEHFPEDGQRENKSRGHRGNVGEHSMEETGDLCLKCEGSGQVMGWVWDPEIIKAWPIVPSVVLDTFAGTGQTLLAGMDLGRDVLGVDLSEKYCRLSNARCEVWPDALPEQSQAQPEYDEAYTQFTLTDDCMIS